MDHPLRVRTHTFSHSRIEQVRLFSLWGLGVGFFEAFCYSDDPLVDVIDDRALLIEHTLQIRCAGLGVVELIAKIGIGLLQILSKTSLTAASLANDEAEGS
jgi:hypothetical protein